jgi:hypothetical protein
MGTGSERRHRILNIDKKPSPCLPYSFKLAPPPARPAGRRAASPLKAGSRSKQVGKQEKVVRMSPVKRLWWGLGDTQRALSSSQNFVLWKLSEKDLGNRLVFLIRESLRDKRTVKHVSLCLAVTLALAQNARGGLISNEECYGLKRASRSLWL